MSWYAIKQRHHHITIKWFQKMLSNSIQYYLFVCIQLKVSSIENYQIFLFDPMVAPW